MAELARPLEEVLERNVGSAEDVTFDETMGALEDILLSDGFSRLQRDFCKRHAGTFTVNSKRTTL